MCGCVGHLRCIHRACGKNDPLAESMFQYIWTKEKHRPCHQVIFDHHNWCNKATDERNACPCLFEDILQLAPEFDPADDFLRKTFFLFARPTYTTQACVTHKKMCVVPYSDYDFSGLPCTDNSRAKRGRQFEEGPTGPLFIIWALRVKRHRVKLAVLENTPDA